MTILWSTVTISFQEREQRICVYSNNLFSPRGHRPADFNHKLVSRSASRYSWTSRNHIVDSYLFIYLPIYLFILFSQHLELGIALKRKITSAIQSGRHFAPTYYSFLQAWMG